MPRRNKGPHLHWDKRREGWYIRWFENGKARVRATGAIDRRRAESELARFIDGSHTGPSDTADRKIDEMLADYLKERIDAVVSKRPLLAAVERLIEWWGGRPVSDISEQECRAYGRWRESGKDRRPVKRASWRYELSKLKAAVRHDWKAKRITSLPHVWNPPKSPPRTRWLERREVASLLRSARKDRARWPLFLFIVIALYTGARKDAILTLRWPQVDMRKGMIDFNEPGRERTGKGRSVIPIPRRLMTFLRIAHKRGTDTGFVITYNQRPLKTIHREFSRVRIAAKLDDQVIPHTLRHTCASWMVQKGVPLYDVAKWLGHATIAQVQATYGHLAPDHLCRAMRALDRA